MPKLKTKTITLGEESLTLHEASGLDYLDYLDYLSENPLPVTPSPDATAAEVSAYIRNTKRVDLLQVSRLVAIGLYRDLALPIDQVQRDIMQNWQLGIIRAVFLESIKLNGLYKETAENTEAESDSQDDESEPVTPKT